MDFSMTTPCATCPFRKEGGIPLTPGRVREIASMMLNSQGGMFPCHKTVDYDDEPEDHEENGFRVPGKDELHCAGALIWAENHNNCTQMMRINERFGSYDHTKFTEANKASVWDSLSQWLRASRAAEKPRKLRAIKGE